jgi:hypothetical protein
MKNICTFRVQNSKNKPRSPKTEFGLQNQYGRSGILYGARKYVLLGVKKVQIDLNSLKTEYGPQNQYARVKYPPIGNYVKSKKKYTFRVKFQMNPSRND